MTVRNVDYSSGVLSVFLQIAACRKTWGKVSLCSCQSDE